MFHSPGPECFTTTRRSRRTATRISLKVAGVLYQLGMIYSSSRTPQVFPASLVSNQRRSLYTKCDPFSQMARKNISSQISSVISSTRICTPLLFCEGDYFFNGFICLEGIFSRKNESCLVSAFKFHQFEFCSDPIMRRSILRRKSKLDNVWKLTERYQVAKIIFNEISWE